MATNADAPAKDAVSMPSIHKTMRVLDIITLCPESESIIAEYGLHCFNCAANAYETLQDGCLTHGFEEEEIDELVDDINQLIHDMPDKPKNIAVTKAAALAILDIAKTENRVGEGLSVIVDGSGGFCLEFQKDALPGEQTFSHNEVPDVRLFASQLTLKRIGGSTIDMRDGKFKLDLDEAAKVKGVCGCSEGGSCGC